MLAKLSIVLGLVAALPASAFGHAALLSPTPRNDNSGLKTGPCGNVAPTGNPTVLAPGQTIEVSFHETIDHPGWYRLAWSAAGDADFENNVLLDDIVDEECVATPCTYTAQITLPDQACEGCSLQLIQYMTENPDNPSLYYSCADITLSNDAEQPDAGSVGGGPDAGGNGGNNGDNNGGSQPVAGGCSASTSVSALWSALLLLAGIASLRRRTSLSRA